MNNFDRLLSMVQFGVGLLALILFVVAFGVGWLIFTSISEPKKRG